MCSSDLLGDYLVSELKKSGFEIISPLARKYRSGITVIKIKNPLEMENILLKKNIIVTARGDGLRVAVHIYNNKKDIDKFVFELKKSVSSV